jgi:TolA-binding protein
MGAVTYPQASVAHTLNEEFVPCKVESASAPELARKMNVRWLPGLVVADHDERPAHVQIGFLPPEDFLDEITFGRAIVAMGQKRYDEAHDLFRRVVERGGERAPDALYWWGISHYRQTKSFADCQRHWSEIVRRWPDSQGARKVRYAVEVDGPRNPGVS